MVKKSYVQPQLITCLVGMDVLTTSKETHGVEWDSGWDFKEGGLNS
jgi:hypothetical protein